jgi:hypothetical protein
VSTTALVQATQAILQTTVPEATIALGIPKTVPDGEVIIYLYHDGSSDEEKAGPTKVQRTHTIPIHVLLRVSGSDTAESTELELMALHDRISDAFYAEHTLSGTATDATLGQRDQPRGGAAGAYVFEGTSEYRHRWWTLTATETLSFVIS